MFDFLKSKSPADLRDQAQAFYEKTVSDRGASRAVKVKLGMLCRTHIDKLFVEGAKQAVEYDKAIAHALSNALSKPEPPSATPHQLIKTSQGEMYSYIPEEFASAIFNLGLRYQTEEVSLQGAIDGAQQILDIICYEELKLPQSFEALRFLRDELNASAAEPPAGPSPSDMQ